MPAGAILLGVPIGFLTAVYLAKMVPRPVKAIVGQAVSMLASIPSVVYSLVGMMVLVPGIRKLFHVPDGASLLADILVPAIMILPSIIKMSVTALEAVPKEYEDASLALGATPEETWFRVSVPAARSRLCIARALAVEPKVLPMPNSARWKEAQGSGRMKFVCSAGINECRSKAGFAPAWLSALWLILCAQTMSKKQQKNDFSVYSFV